MIIIGFIFYFFIIGCIAFSVFLKQKKSGKNKYSQALLANRSVNFFLTALSAQASDMSDWLFMAFPAAIYSGGLLNSWIAIGLVFGMFLTWHFIAAPLRVMTEQYDSMTLSTFFEKRFQDTSGILRILSALLCFIFFSVYLAAGMKGFGFLAESIFEIPYLVGVLIAILCSSCYVLLGGYAALSWIDCFQAIFLFFVIFLVPFKAFFSIGGIGAIKQVAFSRGISLSILPGSIQGWINVFVMAFSWATGYFGTPHILTKFMGINDVSQMKKAQYVGMFWQISVLCAAGASGLIGIAFFKTVLINTELVFIEMVKELFSELSVGFILSAVAGATVSVMTAQILVLVSMITEDFYKGFWKKNASSQELLWIYRISIILLGFFGFLLSTDKTNTIQSLVQYAWIGFGCSFGPLVILSLYSRSTNRYGAYAAMICGGVISLMWKFLFEVSIFNYTGLAISAVVPGFICSILGAFVISRITAKFE